MRLSVDVTLYAVANVLVCARFTMYVMYTYHCCCELMHVRVCVDVYDAFYECLCVLTFFFF